MSDNTRRLVAVPLVIIVLGLAWLLTTLGVGAAIDWMSAAGLGLVAVVALLLGGLNKLTVVVTPWFLAASACSVLHDTAVVGANVIVPVLVILLGCLVLAAVLLNLRAPGFMVDGRPLDHDP